MKKPKEGKVLGVAQQKIITALKKRKNKTAEVRSLNVPGMDRRNRAKVARGLIEAGLLQAVKNKDGFITVKLAV